VQVHLLYFKLKQVKDVAKHWGSVESSNTCRADLSSGCQQSAGLLFIFKSNYSEWKISIFGTVF